MKCVQLNQGKISLQEFPEPQLTKPTDVKIKIAYASICGYEMMVYRNKTLLPESLLGHEVSGIVVEIGPSVSNLAVGDLVAINPYFHCGVCNNCLKGLFRYCLNVEQISNGFMREYVVINCQNASRLPRQLQLREGCLIEPLLVCVGALEKARLDYNRKLLIVGGGAMGQLLLNAALLHPIEGVVVLDPNKSKQELAVAHGAALAVDPRSDDLYYQLMDYTGGAGFDAIIEASGDSKFVSKAFNLLARGGDLVLLSMYEVSFQLPISVLHLYWKDATIHTVYPNYSQFSKAVSIAPRMNLASIITAEYPYTQAAEAFARKAEDHDQLKVVLKFD